MGRSLGGRPAEYSKAGLKGGPGGLWGVLGGVGLVGGMIVAKPPLPCT